MLSLQESELLLAIARAGAQLSGWPEVLRLIAAQLQADAVRLYLPAGGWDQSGRVADPLPEGLAGLRIGRVYTGEELADRALAIMPVAGDLRAVGMAGGWLVLTRRKGAFRAVDSAMLSALAPHIAQALTAETARAALQNRLAQHEQIARRLGMGLLQIEAGGRVTALDSVAQALLARVGGALAVPEQGVRPVAPGLDLAVIAQNDGTRLGVLRATDMALPAPRVIADALGVSLAEARLARALGMGDTLAEAAARLGLTIETARAYSRQIFAKTGLRGQPDLMRRLWSGAVGLG